MQEKRLRVVVDTNIWISFLLTKKFEKLYRLLHHHKIRLIFSSELLEEFLNVAQRPKFKRFFSLDDLHSLLLLIGAKSDYISTTSLITICRDEKDNFLLALAKDAQATHLITGDKDLLVLKTFETTRILTINEFLEKL